MCARTRFEYAPRKEDDERHGQHIAQKRCEKRRGDRQPYRNTGGKAPAQLNDGQRGNKKSQQQLACLRSVQPQGDRFKHRGTLSYGKKIHTDKYNV